MLTFCQKYQSALQMFIQSYFRLSVHGAAVLWTYKHEKCLLYYM